MTFYDPFLIKVGQLKHLLSLEMFFLNSLACVTLKVQSYIFYGAKIQWVTAKKELINSKSNVANVKTTTCFFYILTICTPGNTMDRDMGIWQQALAQQCWKGLDKPAK